MAECFRRHQANQGYVEKLYVHYARIGKVGGLELRFHKLRNPFMRVAERELMLPRSLTDRLVNYSRPFDVIESYAADRTVEQHCAPAQQISGRFDELIGAETPSAVTDALAVSDDQ